MIVARLHDLDRGFMTIAMHAGGLLPQIYDVRGGLTRSADYRNAANSNFSTRMRSAGLRRGICHIAPAGSDMAHRDTEVRGIVHRHEAAAARRGPTRSMIASFGPPR
jgi:hypothetical protein